MKKRIGYLITTGVAMLAITIGIAALGSTPASAIDPPDCHGCTTTNLGYPCWTQQGGAGTLHKSVCLELYYDLCVPETTYSCY